MALLTRFFGLGTRLGFGFSLSLLLSGLFRPALRALSRAPRRRLAPFFQIGTGVMADLPVLIDILALLEVRRILGRLPLPTRSFGQLLAPLFE
jgi:hypothetical protein